MAISVALPAVAALVRSLKVSIAEKALQEYSELNTHTSCCLYFLYASFAVCVCVCLQRCLVYG